MSSAVQDLYNGKTIREDAAVLLVDDNCLALKKVVQYYLKSENNTKPVVLQSVLEYNTEQCIIFVNSKKQVDYVKTFLIDKGVVCQGIHSEMLQCERNQIMQAFKMGEFTVLVASDLLARGIDI